MGLGKLVEEIRLALLARKVWGAVQEGAMRGHLKAVLVGLGGAAGAGALNAVFVACPGLKAGLYAAVVAAIAGTLMTYVTKPRENAGVWATIVGVLTTVGALLGTKVMAICPEVYEQLPGIAFAGAAAAVGLWLKAPKQQG